MREIQKAPTFYDDYNTYRNPIFWTMLPFMFIKQVLGSVLIVF